MEVTNFQIQTHTPLYFIFLCVLLGAALTFSLYYKNLIYKERKFWKFPNILVIITRFIAITLLLILLLNPFIRNIFKRIEQPKIVLAVDNSKSIIANKDSNYYKTIFLKEIDKLEKELSKDFVVKRMTFGENVSENKKIDYSEKKTDIAKFITSVNNKFYNRNLGAIIMATDGVFNEGKNPIYTKNNTTSNFIIALGDTATTKDLFIKNVFYNKVVRLGNDFPIKISVAANKLKGKKTKISVLKDNKLIFEDEFDINSNKFEKNFTIFSNAEKNNIKHFRIQLKPVEEESSLSNNLRDIFIQTISNKNKILIIANSPHPDIGTIRNIIDKNENYSSELVLCNQINEKLRNYSSQLTKYNLVILHQLPSNNQANKIVNYIFNKNTNSTLVILGSQTNIGLFNKLQTGLKISQKVKKMNEVAPVWNDNFSLFNFDKKLSKKMQDFPPLLTPFANFKINSDNQIAIFQKIGAVETQKPLLIFTKRAEQKIGILLGEGLWKWSLNEFKQSRNNDATTQLISKTIQYLAIKTDKRLFKLKNKKSVFYENEKIIFFADVLNPSYEKLKNAQVDMKIINKKNKVYEFKFSENASEYYLNAGHLPVGIYSYNAKTKIGGKIHSINGQFVVKPVDIEFNNIVADHKLLFQMAKQTGGKMFLPTQMEQIAKQLKEQDFIKPMSFLEYDIKDIIDFKILAFLILTLFAVEWFVRKYFGSI